MRLPNDHLVRAPVEKVRDYLLNPAHRTGAPKCAFFTAFGFDRLRWEVFAAALCAHAREYEVAGVSETRYGVLYRVEGALRTPDARTPRVRSVWFIDSDSPAPRLATAYPLPPAIQSDLE